MSGLENECGCLEGRDVVGNKMDVVVARNEGGEIIGRAGLGNPPSKEI